MESDSFGTHQYDDEIDMKKLFGVLWTDKIFIIATTVAFALGFLLYALAIPNQYKATALLAPAQTDGGGLSSALGQLSGLASLAGVSIGEASNSESQIAQEIMKSWSFIDDFIVDNDIAVEVYAAEGWSERSGDLEIDGSLYDSAEGAWLIQDASTDELRPPTSWELFERFSEMLSVSQDKASGLVSVSVEYYSPHIAKKWVDLYISAINEHMQTRQVSKVSSNISYLEEQIERTPIAEMREVFYTIIEEQTKNQMVAAASPDYAFVAVSPSMVPEEKSQPKRALICIFGTVFGALFSVLVSLMRHYICAR